MSSAPPGVERYPIQNPTVNPDPVREVMLGQQCCGLCPAWNPHRSLPFGQCLIAMKALGAPMYRSDCDSCSLTHEDKAKHGYKQA